MKAMELNVARIGNSRGVRLPAKLSWEDTARETAATAEDRSAWDAADGDVQRRIREHGA